MAEQECLMRCFYAVVYQVSMEVAREDLSMPTLAIERFLQNYSWFHSLVNRLHAQAFHKRHKRHYEVDDLFPTMNLHSTIEEEDADPQWFCLRKLKTLFNQVAAELSGLRLDDPRHILLDYVSRFVHNCVENPIDYTARVTCDDYYLELDNLDIKGLSRIVAMCSFRKAKEQGLPTQGLPTQGLPTQGLPTQGLPTQGLPTQGLPTQGLPTQGLPTQGFMPRSSLSARDIERNQRAVIMQQDREMF